MVMKMRLGSAGALILALTVQTISPAFAQEAKCLCEASRSNGGTISEVGGDVGVLGNVGLSAARPGQSLAIGSRVISGADGAGLMSFGRSCSITIEPDTNYDVTAQGDKVCVRASRNAFTPQEAATTGGGISVGVIGAGALVLGGIGAGIAVSSKNASSGNFPPLSF